MLANERLRGVEVAVAEPGISSPHVLQQGSAHLQHGSFPPTSAMLLLEGKATFICLDTQPVVV